jgi:hypothetical protein
MTEKTELKNQLKGFPHAARQKGAGGTFEGCVNVRVNVQSDRLRFAVERSTPRLARKPWD